MTFPKHRNQFGADLLSALSLVLLILCIFVSHIQTSFFVSEQMYKISAKLHVMGNITVHGRLYSNTMGDPIPSNFSKETGGKNEDGSLTFPSNHGEVETKRFLVTMDHSLREVSLHKWKGRPVDSMVSRPGNTDNTYCKYSSTILHVMCFSTNFFHSYDLILFQWKNGMGTFNRPALKNAAVELISTEEGEFFYAAYGKWNFTDDYHPQMYRIRTNDVLRNGGWETIPFPPHESPSHRELVTHTYDRKNGVWTWWSGYNAGLDPAQGLSDLWFFDPKQKRWLTEFTGTFPHFSQYKGSAIYYGDQLLTYGGRENHMDWDSTHFVGFQGVSFTIQYENRAVESYQINFLGNTLGSYGVNPILYQPRGSQGATPYFYFFGGQENSVNSINRITHTFIYSPGEFYPSGGPPNVQQTSGCMLGDYTAFYFDGDNGQPWIIGL
mmetsp:Transcript_524/g.1944  ORF Transcript_524/g.1944 Transcript_524/m.1944 type:complete len:438 (-) Transcript_524:2097-3410(-)